MTTLENIPFDALFLDGSRGRLFGLFFPATGEPKGKLLCIPPFAEESNRCRVMLGMGARAFALKGWSTLILDPYGCGDSEGEFEQARLDTWQADIDCGLAWLEGKPGSLGLWGTRFGALMAETAAIRHSGTVQRLLFWQPVISGKQMFTQYLRLRVANSLEAFGRQETTKELRARLDNGESLEIGGYYISPGLAHGLDQAVMSDGSQLSGARIDWLERVDEGKTELSIGSRKHIDKYRANDVEVHSHPFEGPPFWQLHERFLAPQLVDSSCRALSGDSA